MRAGRGQICAWLLLAVSGCSGPSNHRNWSPNQAVLPSADFDGHLVHVHNIRNTDYRTADDYTVRHYDKTFDLTKVDSVDFIMVPLNEAPGAAHTFLSFGFDGADYLAISVEVRRQKGEEFSVVRSVAKPFEIMYVVGDERDLIGLRTNHWLEDVYMYRVRAPKAQVRALLVDMLQRANDLREKPEYYNLATNNCTTNIVRHVNRVAPGSIPPTHQLAFSLYADRMAYQLDLIDTDASFAQTKQTARVNERAYVHREHPEFSQKIRGVDDARLARRTNLELAPPEMRPDMRR